MKKTVQLSSPRGVNFSKDTLIAIQVFLVLYSLAWFCICSRPSLLNLLGLLLSIIRTWVWLNQKGTFAFPASSLVAFLP